ncbi:unannotated protein [freshwater metagenome]|uniref:Unannotated protein n=1 Tax=freshwater metagenome TaxID=449393 RepID=A0A6J7EQI1_9ZZZZ
MALHGFGDEVPAPQRSDGPCEVKGNHQDPGVRNAEECLRRVRAETGEETPGSIGRRRQDDGVELLPVDPPRGAVAGDLEHLVALLDRRSRRAHPISER